MSGGESSSREHVGDVDASVIVPALNAAATIAATIATLLEQDFDQRWELIVIDNGSVDWTAGVARDALAGPRPPSLVSWQVVSFTDRVGYASPRNHGARLARGGVLLFCDADDRVDRSWLSTLVAAARASPLVASMQVVVDRAGDTRATPNAGEAELPSKFGVKVVHSGGLACTSALFHQLGGFDPDFDTGGEDVDLALRARELGIEPVLASGARYYVVQRDTRSGAFSQAFRNGRSQVMLFQRHRGSIVADASGPLSMFTRTVHLTRKLPWLFDASRRMAWLGLAGHALGRAVWSVRLRVRYF